MPAERRRYTDDERNQKTAQVYHLRKAGRSWNEIANAMGLPKETIRTWHRRGTAAIGPPGADVNGVVPDDYQVDPQEALARAKTEWRRTEALTVRQAEQTITFDYGPIGVAFLADQHLGSEGVDYTRCFEEAELIRDTPGLYAAIVGDICDNYIISRLLFLQTTSRLTTSDEAALLRLYLETLSTKLLMGVSGNHDWWSAMLTGIDYFASALSQQAPNILYGQHQLDVTIGVAGDQYPGRVRHKWKYRSMYNPSHGIEQAYRQDSAAFQWAVGAHTHVSGLSREFNAGGETGVALVLGSYKREDDFAKRSGYPRPNQSTAVTLIFDEYGMRGESNLDRAAEYFQSVYREEAIDGGA